MAQPKSIAIIANKWWEAAPLAYVLSHPDASPKEVTRATAASYVGQARPRPRLECWVDPCVVEVWCIQDWMDPGVSSSSTWEKARVLPHMKLASDLVIGFGTCACPMPSHENGSVVMGSSVFVHDPYSRPPDPARHWTHASLNTIVDSSAEPILGALAPAMLDIRARMIAAPNLPGPLNLHLGAKYVATGVVNVTTPKDYVWADPQALGEFAKVAGSAVSASHETTHGLIRLATNRPFLYVSGVANALGEYDSELAPNLYAQNLVAASNAAVALASLLPTIAATI